MFNLQKSCMEEQLPITLSHKIQLVRRVRSTQILFVTLWYNYKGSHRRYSIKKARTRGYRKTQPRTAGYRNSRSQMFFKIGVLKNFAVFIGKHLCWSLFFNRVADFRPATILKKRLEHKCFPVNIAKFLRTPILKNICERLLLQPAALGWVTSTSMYLSLMGRTIISIGTFRTQSNI